ncbi:hypothetical protein H2198_010327 [Neophaeococcomyces mojaviensis]|uniref:Uncharacterized protein n=1 Tax=Neophaeococcomyces mojaviensis TaxID=3383035 RepID=A0ACC2ZRV7_9EURO|nr:hypothetical protein H2198_010327 [Knufia sp. JES_112]
MPKRENIAIWLNPDGSLLSKTLQNSREPGKGEALVEVLYSGINPADVKHSTLGIHSTVSGYDFCGVVKEIGDGCVYDVGDVIAGYTPTGINRPERFGTHQNYLIYPADNLAFHVPPEMKRQDAACLMVIVRTAADAMFNLLQYPLPGETASSPLKPLLIWGGATSLGLSTIQFAKSIGVPEIFVTASSQHHEWLTKLGATKCFDYRDDNVVENIRAYASLSGQVFDRVFDAVGSMQARTADLALSCAGEGAIVVTATGHAKCLNPFAITEVDVEIDIPGRGRTVFPARPRDAERAQKALLWAVEHYGKEFVFPKVSNVSGQVAKAMQTITAVGRGLAGYGKYVIEHPLF